MKFTEALLILFITLKLTKVISWSWWFVLLPLWFPFVLAGALISIAMVLDRISE